MKISKEKLVQGILDLILNVIVIAILVVVIRTYVISPFQVSGPSMCDTLNVIDGACVPTGDTVGEFMLINKIGYIFGEPKRGDIIVFKPASSEQHYIKRIIGIPEDTVQIKQDNFVYVTPKNGEQIKLNESYLNSSNYGDTRVPRENTRIFHVPEGKYFVMGDNRGHSSDSRHCFDSYIGCQNGVDDAFIGPEVIKGKAFLTLWPPSNIKYIKTFDYGF